MLNPIAKKFNENALHMARAKKFSKTLTNKMTIVMWRLFRSSRTLHFGFMLFRLEQDFGMTEWDVANFTGIPARQVGKFVEATKEIMKSSVLRELAAMDFVEEENGWRALPFRYGKRNGSQQGYFIPKTPEWYAKRRITIRTHKPAFSLGTESNQEIERILEKHGLINNTDKKPERTKVSDHD